MSLWSDEELRKLFINQTPLIDVRAPIEFADGAIPFSVNIPILNDRERSLVGTCYKEKGQAAAIELGHELIQGQIKAERVSEWVKFLKAHPNAEVFCFRGGLRSQISCQWINENGFDKTPISGGYKKLRKFFLSWLDEAPFPDLIRLGGPTGSGKSELIVQVPHVDLEKLAHHRGSAFGSLGKQPTQITFENNLALEMMKLHGKRFLIEDESITIGKIVIPRRFYQHLRCAPLIIVKVDREERVRNIFEGYVSQNPLNFFQDGLDKIHRSLGGAHYQMIKSMMLKAFEAGSRLEDHAPWIDALLKFYYDRIYLRDIERNRSLIQFEGSREEVLSYLQTLLRD